jgi:hypothetical protein
MEFLEPTALLEKAVATRHRSSSVPQSKDETRPVLLVKLDRKVKDPSSSPSSDATTCGLCGREFKFRKSCQLSDGPSKPRSDKPEEIQPAIWLKEGMLLS